ncbi:MAG TPA: peptide chain release factor N(5)-glutamine methyltransferase [Solirubrobacterales bacterium]|nr:peptide chain release factor N(5)-glutamine methyltransferase [Solirubrobacterales bacterium]
MPAVAGTVRDALEAACDAFVAAGVEGPRFDAELLLSEAAGIDRARLEADPGAALDAVAARRFGAMVRRRVAREPVAYILGRRWFRRIELAVDPRALIPRPETEALVEAALELRPRSVCDIGTGSGAVALAIADELPDADVVATETSPDALALARENAGRLGLADRIRFEQQRSTHRRESDRSAIPHPLPAIDLVVANLPYVSEREWPGLAPEITRYEPRSALVAGPTGLEAIESVLAAIAAAPVRPAAVALEVGAGQAPAVSELFRAAGYRSVSSRPDLAGIERIVVGGDR